IGVVDRGDGPRLARELKPGQRLVSREGDLWRWDGFAAAASAQTPAARRLAQRNRLGDLERELAAARAAIGQKRGAGEHAEAELAQVSGEVSEKRRTLAEARGEAQSLAREAELRARRLEAIASEKSEWQERANLANGQIATLDLRSAEAATERQSLDAAPAVFAEKRRALIDEMEA